MASSFSTNLRLELQTTGENTATWGSLANQVFEMIEDAVSGYVTVNIADADLTLTANSGTVDQSRNMFLNFTGTLTADRTVTIPAVSKTYIVRNATTGGFSVVIKVSATSNTYTLLRGVTTGGSPTEFGAWKYVYTNGTTIHSSEDWLTQSSQVKRWGIPAYIASDGVTEVGTFLDFHNTNTDTNNFSLRLGTATALGLATTTDLYITPASGSARKVWNDGNDGASSGLDADMVDGLHATAFQLAGTLPPEAVTLTGVQTLTNKTLTSPAINNATFTGNGYFTGAVQAQIVTSVRAETGNVHMWMYGAGGADRFLIYTDAATAGNTYMRVNGGYTWTFDAAGGLTIPGGMAVTTAGSVGTSLTVGSYIQASGTNIYLGDISGARILQFQGNYYLKFSTSTGVLSYVMGGGEVAHFGSSGITSSTKMWSETGYFISTTTSCQVCATGTTGYVYLRPRGADNSTFEARVSSATGDFHAQSLSEGSDDTLKSNWKLSTKSIIDDVAKLEVGSFTWKGTAVKGYGIRAQALRAIMPEVVTEDENGMLGVSYGKAAMGIAIDACRRILALEARIAELEARMA